MEFSLTWYIGCTFIFDLFFPHKHFTAINLINYCFVCCMFELSIFIIFQVSYFLISIMSTSLNHKLFKSFKTSKWVFLNYPFLISKLLALWLKNLISKIKFCDIFWQLYYSLVVVNFYKYSICNKTLKFRDWGFYVCPLDQA